MYVALDPLAKLLFERRAIGFLGSPVYFWRNECLWNYLWNVSSRGFGRLPVKKVSHLWQYFHQFLGRTTVRIQERLRGTRLGFGRSNAVFTR